MKNKRIVNLINEQNDIDKIYLYARYLSEPTLHEKPHFPGPGISWKAKKSQVNIIFPSTFWLKKYQIFHPEKFQNKNFFVISKHGILKKISSYRFFIGPKHPLLTFLKRYYGKIIFLPTSCVGKDFFCYQKS